MSELSERGTMKTDMHVSDRYGVWKRTILGIGVVWGISFVIVSCFKGVWVLIAHVWGTKPFVEIAVAGMFAGLYSCYMRLSGRWLAIFLVLSIWGAAVMAVTISVDSPEKEIIGILQVSALSGLICGGFGALLSAAAYHGIRTARPPRNRSRGLASEPNTNTD